jgi:hypothetical protein
VIKQGEELQVKLGNKWHGGVAVRDHAVMIQGHETRGTPVEVRFKDGSVVTVPFGEGRILFWV